VLHIVKNALQYNYYREAFSCDWLNRGLLWSGYTCDNGTLANGMQCPTESWLVYVLTAFYLLISNILMLNILIAIFKLVNNYYDITTFLSVYRCIHWAISKMAVRLIGTGMVNVAAVGIQCEIFKMAVRLIDLLKLLCTNHIQNVYLVLNDLNVLIFLISLQILFLIYNHYETWCTIYCDNSKQFKKLNYFFLQ